MVVGCKVVLRKEKIYPFLNKLIHLVLPKDRYLNKISYSKIDSYGNFSFSIKDIIAFYELEEFYESFNNISNLDVTIVTTTKDPKDSYFLLSSIGLPFK